ncbi:MAG TPA: HAD hydrolase-like protein [Chryseosolibacter sp.]
MEYQLAVFDLAGTTVKDNYDVHRVLQRAMRKHDVHISIQQANEVMGIPKPVAIHQLLMESGNHITPVTRDIVDSIHKHFVEEMVHFYETDPSVSEKDGVSETFEALKKMGIKVCVNTGFDRPITNALLGRLRWERDGLIDGSVTSDEVPRGRPHPDMILKLMATKGVRYGNYVIKVGDTASDIQEGRASNCGMVVGVTTGAFTKEALLLEEPDYTIDHIRELLHLIPKS